MIFCGLTALRDRGGVIIQFEQPTHRGGPRGRRCDMCSMLPLACFPSIPLPPSHPGPILLCPSHTPTRLFLFRLFSGPDLKVLGLFGPSNISVPVIMKSIFGSAYFLYLYRYIFRFLNIRRNPRPLFICIEHIPPHIHPQHFCFPFTCPRVSPSLFPVFSSQLRVVRQTNRSLR